MPTDPSKIHSENISSVHLTVADTRVMVRSSFDEDETNAIEAIIFTHWQELKRSGPFDGKNLESLQKLCLRLSAEIHALNKNEKMHRKRLDDLLEFSKEIDPYI